MNHDERRIARAFGVPVRMLRVRPISWRGQLKRRRRKAR